MQTGSRGNTGKIFDITQKGKFLTKRFKSGFPPKHFFTTMHDEASHIAVLLNVLLVRRMRVYTSVFWYILKGMNDLNILNRRFTNSP